MRRTVSLALLSVFPACLGWGQTAGSHTFEVASVKQAAPQTMGRFLVGMSGGPGSRDPERVTITNMSLKNLLTTAYDMKGYQITGPGWLDGERFDVTAKVAPGATREQFRTMLQNLLVERFKMEVHREKKELPVYALIVGKNGPKLKESVEGEAPLTFPAPPGGRGSGATYDMAVGPPPPPPPGGGGGRAAIGGGVAPPQGGRGMMMMMNAGRMVLNANQTTMASLCDMLSMQLGRPVLDMTGLTAKYTFVLDFVPDEGQRMMGPAGLAPPPPPPPGMEGVRPSSPDGHTGPSLVTAVQEQLGLKLDARKGPVDIIVVDRAEKVPTEN